MMATQNTCNDCGEVNEVYAMCSTDVIYRRNPDTHDWDVVPNSHSLGTTNYPTLKASFCRYCCHWEIERHEEDE